MMTGPGRRHQTGDDAQQRRFAAARSGPAARRSRCRRARDDVVEDQHVAAALAIDMAQTIDHDKRRVQPGGSAGDIRWSVSIAVESPSTAERSPRRLLAHIRAGPHRGQMLFVTSEMLGLGKIKSLRGGKGCTTRCDSARLFRSCVSHRTLRVSRRPQGPAIRRLGPMRPERAHCGSRPAASKLEWSEKMPIRKFIEGKAFDPEAIEIMSKALANVCTSLGLVDKDDPLIRLVTENHRAHARRRAGRRAVDGGRAQDVPALRAGRAPPSRSST